MEQAGKQGQEGLTEGLLEAAEGAGPLLQRDYWGLIRNCKSSPAALMDLVATRFGEFAPEELCVFERSCSPGTPLSHGEEVGVRIPGAGNCQVRVIHRDRQSFTLATLPGHPEAGRITFGAYRNDHGDVIFHIRSRARSGSTVMYMGFWTGGEAMQTNTWTDFVNAVALTAGEGIIGFIHAETTVMEEQHESADDVQGPTFFARGDET